MNAVESAERAGVAEAIRAARAAGRANPIEVVTWWRGRSELDALDAKGAPWLLLESTEDGGLALGPVFGWGGACFQCYFQRRVSCGARHFRPFRGAGDALLYGLRGLLEEVQGGGPSPLRASQATVDRGGAVTFHRFFPVPGCPRCAKTAWPRASLEDVVSARIGLVRSVAEEEGPGGLWWAAARGAAMRYLFAVEGLNHGGAVDPSRERARTRAIAEALERYACGVPHRGEVLATLESLRDRRVVHPQELSTDFGPVSGAMHWLPATQVADGRPAWVPAASAYMPLPYALEPGEPYLPTMGSTGLAAGPSVADAVQRAVFEVVERDALMRAWRSGRSVERLSPSPVVPDAELVLVPCDAGLYVVAAFIEGERVPFSASGSAAGTDLDETAARAALEARHNHHRLCALGLAPAAPNDDLPGTLEAHLVLHATKPELRERRRRWLDAPIRTAPLPRLEDAAVLRSVEGACFVDLTPTDLALAGVHVVRALVPGAVPFDDDARRPRLAGDPTPHPFA